ncbi:ribokinase [Agromyces atrinae]|uniref:ribokinase n=1 Tax=Agromyces atrinae TaxID=592376 RepID=UPI001F5685BC|nr:ribokinase [Agromyces atrinae]MCI2958717.1 ribokinase [Agromyces atrinae]
MASINVDITVTVARIPAVGETILGTSVQESRGGKGANQAVALARLGTSVAVIGSVGEGAAGDDYRNDLASEGIDVSHVSSAHGVATGTALITVADDGDNNIVVVPAANAELSVARIEAATHLFPSADVVVAQFEVPLESTAAAFRRAREEGAVTVLNPAPAHEDSASLLDLTDVLVPNELEFEQLTGVAPTDDDALREACAPLFARGVAWVVVTLGGDGVALVGPDTLRRIPAKRVVAVDTTAAGDSFIAGLSSVIAAEKDAGGDALSETTLRRACEYATTVASVTVQGAGAQPSLPFAKDIA